MNACMIFTLIVLQAYRHELQQALTHHEHRHSHSTDRLCQLLQEAWQCRAFCASVNLESANLASVLKSARFAGCGDKGMLHLNSVQLTLTHQQVKEIVVRDSLTAEIIVATQALSSVLFAWCLMCVGVCCAKSNCDVQRRHCLLRQLRYPSVLVLYCAHSSCRLCGSWPG